MSCQYNLLFLFLCGFAALSVSTKPCKTVLTEGTSCIIPMKTTKEAELYEIKWTHDKKGIILRWKNGKITRSEGVDKEGDGSLRFQSVSVKDTGTYTFNAFDSQGTQIGKGEIEIKVYANVSKPTVTVSCTADGNATLTCDVKNNKDTNLNVSWYKDGKKIQNDKKSDQKLFLSFAQVQESIPYSCEASNPVSTNKSEKSAVSCTGKGSGLGKLFGFDFWIMVSILAGGGALLLLLICVLVICACRSCHQRTKHQKDEEELRLADLTPSHTGTNRSKQTARGQPAPPIPQEDPMPCSPSPETPPRTQAQPKAQIRARPPPPPQDEEEEYPPPLPHPRQKQHRTKRNQEPYRPME